jgi:uncharacterized protein
MKKSKAAKRRVTAQEWFYLGCLAAGVAAGIVGTSIMASGPKAPDHSSKLLEASGVVPWHALAKVSIEPGDGKPRLKFGDSVNDLNGRTITLRGYITPLQFGSDQKHFILSPKPPACAFCMPGGPDEMVEVFTRTPVKYSINPVTVAGTFALLQNDPGGLFYRLADAAAVQPEGRL